MGPQFPERFNMAHYFLDARVEEGLGERTAVVHCVGDSVARHSYAEVQALANRLANRLRAGGVGVEDRVLIILPDGPLFAATFFAVLKLGAVVAMVNPELPADDYPYYLEYTRARALVCEEAFHERVRPASRHLRSILRAGGGLEGELAGQPPTFENEPTSKDDVAVWLFTSGSTG